MTSPRAVAGMTICPECFCCRGEFELRSPIQDSDENLGPDPGHTLRLRQRCRCEVASTEKPWIVPGTGARFDFNTYLELCRCCGVEAIRSGSRWSSFYCSDCRQRVGSLNHSAGRWVIPMGRHSVMHGVTVRGDESLDQQIAERFVGAAGGLFAAMNHLDAWAQSVVQENLSELGFAAGQEVPLSDYLDAARERIDAERAFERLSDAFAHLAAVWQTPGGETNVT